MRSQTRLRLATEHDLNELVRLEEVAFQTDRFTRAQIDYLLTESRATTFVVDKGVRLIAMACILWRKSNLGGRIYNLAVDPSCQSRGLGAKLLKECELEAARRNCTRIVLEVREDNQGAVRFYEKHGYAITRVMPDYYSDGSPGLKMARELNIDVPRKLRYDIPYYHQTLDFTCGPACLMMGLKYFYPETNLTRALEMTLWKEATLIFMAAGLGGTDGYGLALSALNRGLFCRLVMSMESTPLLKSVRKQHKQEVMKIVHNDLKRKAKAAGLGSAFYEYGMEEIESALHRHRLPIVMISTYRLTGDRVPHWVIVTGFDRDHVFIHDPDVASYRKNRSRARNLKVEKTEFLRMTRFGKEAYRCLMIIGRSEKN